VNLAHQRFRGRILNSAMSWGPDAGWDDQREPDVVFSSSACPAGHLMKLGSREVGEFAPVNRSLCTRTTVRAGKLTPAATVEVEKMASRYPGHHFLNQDFPVRKLTGVVRAHCGIQEKVFLSMTLKVRYFSRIP